MRISITRTLGTVATAAVCLTAGVTTASAAPGPATDSFAAAFGYSLFVPNADTPGANDWSCDPSSSRPRPVVLVHGTWENRYDNWASLSPRLKSDGYCVFALNYGDDANSALGLLPSLKGTSDIAESAEELAAFVDDVRAATGADEVDIVGHSQGGLMARQYLKFEGGASEVNRLVTLGATHHGTTLSGIGTLGATFGLLGAAEPFLGEAAIQQVVGSDFLATLNAGGDTVPGVDYTVIATKYDEVTTPYQSTFLTAGPGATVQNITIQTGCPIDFSDHLSMSFGPRISAIVRNALKPGSVTWVPCLPKAPVL
ncbi:MAG: alpha/beta fold hydrolase [Patulibacter sp.]|nr:alpha/beta fold hydrolase [Patulibacter sp.]